MASSKGIGERTTAFTAAAVAIDLTSDDDARTGRGRQIRTILKRWIADSSSQDCKPPARKLLCKQDQSKVEPLLAFGRPFEPLPFFNDSNVARSLSSDDCAALLSALRKDEKPSNTAVSDHSAKSNFDTAVGKTDPNERHSAQEANNPMCEGQAKTGSSVGKIDPNKRFGLHKVNDQIMLPDGKPQTKAELTGQVRAGSSSSPSKLDQEASDLWVARQLQDQLDKELRAQEEDQMKVTVTGRAYKFVEVLCCALMSP